ncbi:MAG: Choline-sulfatase [uncultured Thermomicrobiales bacterium]|uniref:Choline-sulfatase n=1 Tax=uncultured Thermomicrobiales bacterium TaxID=1645740 RepID=A0A6J4VEL0_9BACT|nr:MAG: Choline-sulfatase [uncultured Thermomicrobiales bacterium]
MTARPNILLFVSDQQQWQTVCGRSPARSPNIDRLAAEGVRFERPYATVALCCPSRAALLSGQFPWHNGILNQIHVPERTRSDMVPGVQTYSQRLRDAGYRLGYSGKWHVSWERTPLDFGFHDVRAPNGYNPATLSAAGIAEAEPGGNRGGEIEAECRVSWPGSAPFTFYGLDHGPEETTGAHIATSAGIELIERYGREAPEEPWFVTINVVEPHDPYTPLAPYAAGYDPADVALPASWGDDFAGKPNLNRREAGLWAGLSEGQVRTAIARYWAYCEQVDAQVGRVLAALDQTGQAAETLVIFTSDHGDMAGAHRQFIKGWQPYEETYRVPLVMRWPGTIAPGGVCERLVQLHDLAHTFVEVADAAPIAPPDGRSLLPLLRDPAAVWDDVAFCQYYGGEFLYTQRMVITPRHKYVFNGWDFDELYDLVDDPHELRNRVDDPAYRGTCDALREILWARMERHDDPYAQNRYGAPRYLPRPAHDRKDLP